MITSLYVDALLADEFLADQVWELWNAGLIGEELAEIAWVKYLLLLLFINNTSFSIVRV